MSILIKGIEMPTEQTDVLIIAIQSDGSVFPVYIDEEGNPMIFQNEEMQNRAILVPDHGDLIDYDFCMKNYELLHDDDGNPVYAVRMRDINNAPTIIPADKEVEG